MQTKRIWSAFSLRTRIGSIFSAMAVIVVVGVGSMLWYTHQIDTMLVSMVNKDFVLYKTAQDMELALSRQKGLLTYYLVDGDGEWLKLLGQHREAFHQIIEMAQRLELTPNQRQSLDVITKKYSDYIKVKDAAIENYKNKPFAGNISAIHEKQRDAFFAVLDLCQTFSENQWQVIVTTKETTNILSRNLRMVAFIAIGIFTFLCSLFLYILYKHILGPIRGLALETGSSAKESSRDEVGSLTHSLKGMIRDFDETSDELARSRKNLQQAERMVMVGELAAGVAHTIRNPFTSIKMRMFSLGRSLELNAAQSEDIQVISDEIARIDRIVENFLEFARSPKLRLKECRLGEIINSVLILLEYRLKAFNVEMQYDFQANLPQVNVDPDRIKEAIVNLIINACEAMETGGRICITETHEIHPEMGDVVALTITDTGPGIPETLTHKVITPFFTTKEDGSGLGLSIVVRIVREHNGRFIISQNIERGAQCIILLPVGGDKRESDPDN